ncbi:hypothetical protein SAMN05428945_1792 [Streptomyces sp. 2224.1]|nr:hypothetical protein BX261_3537 [Streptomyces sp. 2321.6]SDR40925.1 hypothetical protein SAMN05216511_3665 [Streptomyces sp. KS_16]SEC01424.1 hypothetical protein SAMN05428945_1792 [Streptomyces sp. 2224.1]SED01475.1 hypothetical protein SAMN05428940_3538 [Streptomyces sp. 2133.1]SEE74210.1 hypothetical protein SAMN05428954_3711 [Streptomyces sp. 2112.3]SNC69666.1 hypothetical protein SAMN06272741_3530 [Streptomyces sp. 2114.4]
MPEPAHHARNRQQRNRQRGPARCARAGPFAVHGRPWRSVAVGDLRQPLRPVETVSSMGSVLLGSQ